MRDDALVGPNEFKKDDLEGSFIRDAILKK
jgi:hypothetical protein